MASEELLDFEIAKAETIKRRKFNPYRKVMGKVPTAVEMASWSHDQWMDFLRFTALFIERDIEKDIETFKFTDDKRNTLNDFLAIPSHPFQELIYRIDRWPGEHSNADYRFKFQAMVRVVLTYLKQHPSLIDPNMKVIIDSYPKRLGWVLAQYKTIQTHAGEMTVRDDSTDTQSTVTMPSIQTKMMNSLIKVADIYENIAASIKDKDVKDMKLTEKLKALKDLSFVFATTSKKQATNHLTMINIGGKNAKAVEEGMMDYIKKSQEK